MMFRRMRNRILLVNMTITTALLAILLSVIYLTTYNQIQADNLAELEHISRWSFYTTATVAGEAIRSGEFGHAVSAFRIADDSGDGVQIEEQSGSAMIRMSPLDLSHSFHVLVNATGDVMRINSYISLTEEECSTAAASVWESGQAGGTLQAAGHTLMYTMQPLNPLYLVTTYRDGAAYAQLMPTAHRMTFLDVTASRNTLRELLTTELTAAAVGLIVIFAISYFFANRSIAPIARSWDRQKQFVADASHELKTPLAIISANSDALLASPDETVESQRQWIDYIKSETVRMSRLVNSMLALAQSEAPASVAHTRLDLSELVTDAVLSMEVVAFEKGLSLQADLAPDLHIVACQEDIGRMVLILLDNAVKYTDPGGCIEVALTQERRYATLTVFNSGEGLPKEVLSHIFERFYRADAVRNQVGGSFGLGLSIAKNIVEQAGGTITADSRPGAGVTLRVALPATEPR